MSMASDFYLELGFIHITHSYEENTEFGDRAVFSPYNRSLKFSFSLVASRFCVNSDALWSCRKLSKAASCSNNEHSDPRTLFSHETQKILGS